MFQPYPMTEEGKEKLEEKLQQLKNKKLAEAKEKVNRGRTFCDFSEDSTYSEAVAEVAAVHEQISQLEYMVRNAVPLESEQTDVVVLGTTVTFRELPKGKFESYRIVDVTEANPMKGKISNESPIAESMLGHRAGDQVIVSLPSGEIKIEIDKVESE